MYVRYEDARYLRDILRGLTLFMDEATFRLEPYGGLKLYQLTPDRICLVDLLIDNYAFMEYEVRDETQFSVSLDGVAKMLKNVYKDNEMILRPTDKELEITLISPSGLERRFSIELLDIQAEETPDINLWFTAGVKMITTDLERIVRDIIGLSDVVAIEIGHDGISFTAADRWGDVKYTATIDKYAAAALDRWCDERARALYRIQYLRDISRAIKPIAPAIDLKLSTNKPLKVAADLASGGHLVFYLAPRVEP